MRILMLGWELPPAITGGLGIACAGLGRALVRAGHRIVFVMPRRAGRPMSGGMRVIEVALSVPPGGIGVYPGGASTDATVGPPSVYGPYPGMALGALSPPSPTDPGRGLGAYGPGPYPAASGRDRIEWVASAFAESAARAAATLDFDLVHCHDWLTIPAGLRVREQSGKPLVVHLHSLETDRNGACPDPAVRGIEAAGVQGADAVVAVSRYSRERILREFAPGPDRVAVVHNGVDPDTFAPVAGRGAASRPPTALFLGRVTRQKAPETFVRAAARVRRTVPDARFILAGSGDRLEAVRTLAAELGLDEAIEFPGAVPWAEVPNLLSRVDLLAMPSISEPFGIAALEAAASGVAVILSENCGVREVLPDAPTAPPFDACALAERISGILRDPDRRRKVSRANLQAAGNVTWEAAAARLAPIYRSVARAAAE